MERKPKKTPDRKKQIDHYESPIMGKAKRVANTLSLEGKAEILSDVQGSYTGMDIDGGHPVQDADDL